MSGKQLQASKKHTTLMLLSECPTCYKMYSYVKFQAIVHTLVYWMVLHLELRQRMRESAQIAANLVNEIRQGRMESGSYLPTVRELSIAHGVAHNTAWRVLKTLEREGLVEAEPRKGYRVVAGCVRCPKPLTYVIARENFFAGWDLLYRNLLQAFERIAQQRNQRMMKVIMNAGEESMVLSQLKAEDLAGLVVDTPNRALLSWATEARLPAVIVDDWESDLKYDTVVQNNFAGGMLAAQYLVSKGCKRAAWFGSMLNRYHAQSRLGGALPTLAVAGVPLVEQRFASLDDPGLSQMALEMLKRPNRPDGIMALWRPMADAVAKAALNLGLRLGHDLHLVSWVNAEAIEEGYLPLFAGGPVPPAIVWRTEDMAQVALEALEQRRTHPAKPLVCHQLPVLLKEFP